MRKCTGADAGARERLRNDRPESSRFPGLRDERRITQYHKRRIYMNIATLINKLVAHTEGPAPRLRCEIQSAFYVTET